MNTARDVTVSGPAGDIEALAAQCAEREVTCVPLDLDYESLPGLRTEARQRLAQFRPVTVGQASRISGVTPADIAVLLVRVRGRR